MKSWISDRRLIAGIISLALICLSSVALANVGRTVGTYAVSPTGAAAYSVPIWAPRGPNGLQPAISLAYNSQSGSGYLGVGWSLSGVSTIYRCTQTYAQDPAPAPVALTMNDVFCIDGQRLRLTGGSYGGPDSTYQTEIANFANVTAYGAAGYGPAYFEVQGRDGRTYEYGNGGGSQVLASGTSTAWTWYLDKVTDRAGNTMTIAYTTQNGSAVPATISWTPSSYGATTYNYTMQFAYGSNVPQSSIYGYVGGTPYSNTSLLTSISVNYAGTTVKKYVLSYQQSLTTGRDELTQLQECADAAATNCLAPTLFTYQAGQLGVSTAAATAASSVSTGLHVHDDFNGDGLNDLAYCNNGSPNIIYVAFASASGYGSPVNTGIPCNNPLYGNLTGSGEDGILVHNGTDWWYYTWTTSGFSGQDTGLAYDSTAYQYALADVNGDGLQDLISESLVGSNYNIYVRFNSSQGGNGSVSFSNTSNLWYQVGPSPGNMISNTDSPGGYNTYGTLKALDFNGDGRQDLVLQVTVRTTLTTFELISGNSSFTSVLVSSQSVQNRNATTFLDFNSDGCTDYAQYGVIYISGCNGTIPQQISLAGATVIGAMDWDGDGHTDILVANGSTIGVYLSEGNGLSSLQTTSIPYSTSNLYFAFDANGDGLDDLGVYASSLGAVTYYPHNAPAQKPDLLSSVTDGYGNFAKPTYVPLAQGVNTYYFEWNDAQYPYQNYLGPLYVVNQTTFSDPSNSPSGTYQQKDFYAGAWMNLQGRGFAGFGQHQRYDSRNGIWETFGYGRSFPYTGILNQDFATQNNTSAETIFNRSYTLADTVLQSTQYAARYFPYVSSSTEKDYEVGGTENGVLITTKSGSYSYDNYGNVTSASQTTTDNDPGSPYDGDSWTTTISNTPDVSTGSWCLNLLTESQVSYSASNGSPSVTRTRQYTPDTTYCRYTQITTEPSSSSYEVTEALGYDGFGNISSDTVTGIGMAARQSSASWGTTGQFPMSVQDASGATTQFNYNFSYGLVSSETDPNGLMNSWQYGDGFGRPTRETRPDGTYTTYTYSLASPQWDPLPRLYVTQQSYDKSGNLINTVVDYSNMLDQPMYRMETLLGGKNSWVVTRYYDSLGRLHEDCPPVWQNTATSNCTVYTYDILNRPTQMQRPINQNDSTLQTTLYAYAGRAATITDPNGHARTLIHDVNGWLRQTKDAGGYAVTLGYDAAGAKTSVADSLGNTLWTGTYAYGIAPFLVGDTDSDLGAWGYTVDALGERTAWTDAKGQHFYASYDALSRPLTRTEPDLFTQWTWGSSATSHNIGKLQAICMGSGSACSSSYNSETDTYDNLGRLYQRTSVYPAWGTFIFTWQYNATTGLLDTLTYPGNGVELKYAYQNGILQSITDILASPNVTVWQANAQNPAGQITQETLGNGLVTTRAYDAVTHWLSSVQSGPGGGTSLQNQSFLYDEVGNVTQRQDNNLGLSENFYYDGDNRLSYSTLNGTQNLSLSYNVMGNITSRSDVAGGAGWTYALTHPHEVTQAGSSAYQYAYDANGNMTSRQGNSITWSSYNYPTGIADSATGESVSFKYNSDRSAWYEQTNGPQGLEQLYNVGGLYNVVQSGGVADYRHYVYAGSEPVAMISRKSGVTTIYYLQSDHQGSVTAITNSTGGLVVNESFTAFGSRRNPSTWSGAPSSSDLATIAGVSRHGYTFQESLASMGLNDMVGRVQDAVTGRFLSPDPTLQHPEDPQDYNSYSYVVNNPMTYIDPTGFSSCRWVETAADLRPGEVTVANENGTGGELVCDVVPTPPETCTKCSNPAPQPSVPSDWPWVPPDWESPSTNPPPGGSPSPSGSPRLPRGPARPARPSGPSQAPPQKVTCPAGMSPIGSGSRPSSGGAPASPPPRQFPNDITAADVFATAGSMNDVLDMTASVTKAVGAGGEFVETAAPYVAAPISVGFVANGIRTGNSDQIFDGSYGLLTLGVAAFVSAPVAIGMALGKLGSDAAGLEDPDQSIPNILEVAALCQ